MANNNGAVIEWPQMSPNGMIYPQDLGTWCDIYNQDPGMWDAGYIDNIPK